MYFYRASAVALAKKGVLLKAKKRTKNVFEIIRRTFLPLKHTIHNSQIK